MLDIHRRGTSIPLLIVLLLVPLAVQAQDSQEVEDYLVSVSRLYEDLEYERALEQIDRAKRMTRGVEADVALVLYEGIILADMGKMEEATAAFKAALFLRPDSTLPVQVSPKVAQHFESVRVEVKRDLAPIRARREAQRRQDEARRPQEGKPVAPLATEVPAAARETEVSARGPSRSRALIPAIAGGALVVAGGVFYGLAKSEQSKLRGDDAGLGTRADAQASASRGKTYQTVGLGLVGAGVVGLGVATGLYLMGAPSESVALGVSTDGTSAFVYGSWR
jgi:tetratricopeptide (TPR) repeat protein